MLRILTVDVCLVQFLQVLGVTKLVEILVHEIFGCDVHNVCDPSQQVDSVALSESYVRNEKYHG